MITGRALNITALASIPMGGLVGGPFLHKMMAGVGLILTDLAGGITGLAKLVLLFILLQMTIGALVPVVFGIGGILVGKIMLTGLLQTAIQAGMGMRIFVNGSPLRIIMLPGLGNGRFLRCAAIFAGKGFYTGLKAVCRLGFHTLIPIMSFSFGSVAQLTIADMLAGIIIGPSAVAMAASLGNRLGFCTTAGFAGEGFHTLFVAGRLLGHLTGIPGMFGRIHLTALRTGAAVDRIICLFPAAVAVLTVVLLTGCAIITRHRSPGIILMSAIGALEVNLMRMLRFAVLLIFMIG